MKPLFRAVLILSFVAALKCFKDGSPNNFGNYQESDTPKNNIGYYQEIANTSQTKSVEDKEELKKVVRILIPVQIVLVLLIGLFVLYRKCRYPNRGIFEFKKTPLEGFTKARDKIRKPFVKIKHKIKKPKLKPSCPQIKDEIWTKEAEKHFLPHENGYESNYDDELYLEPMEHSGTESHDYVSIDINEQVDRKLRNKGIPDVENLRIDPVEPVYIEPYEETMRQGNDYSPNYDCYYDLVSHVLSDEGKTKSEYDDDYTDLNYNDVDENYEALQNVQSESVYEDVDPAGSSSRTIHSPDPEYGLPVGVPMFLAIAATRFKDAARRKKEELENVLFGATTAQDDEIEMQDDRNTVPDVEKIKAKYRKNEPSGAQKVKNQRNKNVIGSLAAKAEMLSINGKDASSMKGEIPSETSRTRNKKKMKTVDGSSTTPKEPSNGGIAQSKRKTLPTSAPPPMPETGSPGKRKTEQPGVPATRSGSSKRRTDSKPPSVPVNKSGSPSTKRKKGGRDPASSGLPPSRKLESPVCAPPQSPMLPSRTVKPQRITTESGRQTAPDLKGKQVKANTISTHEDSSTSDEDEDDDDLENSSSTDSLAKRLLINPKLTTYKPYGEWKRKELLENSRWRAVQHALRHHNPVFPPIKPERKESESDWSTHSKDDLIEKDRRNAKRIMQQFQDSGMKDGYASSNESLHLEEMLETEQKRRMTLGNELLQLQSFSEVKKIRRGSIKDIKAKLKNISPFKGKESRLSRESSLETNKSKILSKESSKMEKELSKRFSKEASKMENEYSKSLKDGKKSKKSAKSGKKQKQVSDELPIDPRIMGVQVYQPKSHISFDRLETALKPKKLSKRNAENDSVGNKAMTSGVNRREPSAVPNPVRNMKKKEAPEPAALPPVRKAIASPIPTAKSPKPTKKQGGASLPLTRNPVVNDAPSSEPPLPPRGAKPKL